MFLTFAVLGGVECSKDTEQDGPLVFQPVWFCSKVYDSYLRGYEGLLNIQGFWDSCGDSACSMRAYSHECNKLCFSVSSDV